MVFDARRAVRALLGMVVVAALCAACSDDGGGGGGGSGPDAGCPAEWPSQSNLAGSGPEAEYLDDLRVCVDPDDPTSAWLSNESGVVWNFQTADLSAAAELYGDTDESSIFREGVQQFMPGIRYYFMAPGESTVFGADTADGTRSIRWFIDSDLTAAWLAQEVVVDKLETLEQSAVTTVLGAGSAARRAVLSCGFAAGTSAEAIAGVESGSDAFFAAFAVVGSSPVCVKDWSAARIEAGATKIPTLEEGVITVARYADNVTTAQKVLSFLQRACSALCH
ncbi:hypothetical protein ACFQRL_01020 [Microbacterium fluvii]|uniref:Uncharacterized protein n=1 Tax=Microbacterium fluvii TaxID=415215 RepID=A0ABW2HAT0_9MICO|nr:hypothetical protein [Microbacterium fluvii]MCU4671168.1 hypothetical protein [Microbacterium fluvii]